MDDLVSHLENALHHRFPGSSPALSLIESGSPIYSRVGGFLVWDGFDGVSQRERQRQIWDLLRSDFTTEQQVRVSAILTLTPLEEQVMLENE